MEVLFQELEVDTGRGDAQGTEDAENQNRGCSELSGCEGVDVTQINGHRVL